MIRKHEIYRLAARKLLQVIALGALLGSQSVMAFQFIPSDTEWLLWPDFCKARYVSTTVGRQSPFADQYPKLSREAGKANWGEGFWHVHHACAATVLIQRSLATTDETQSRRYLRDALDECAYSFPKTPSSSPLYKWIAIQIALAHKHSGDYKQAHATLDGVLKQTGGDQSVYLLLGITLREMGKLAEAGNILKEGIDAATSSAPELHYVLGLTLLDLQDVEGAKKHADMAYSLGYPLPGLKNRLSRARQ